MSFEWGNRMSQVLNKQLCSKEKCDVLCNLMQCYEVDAIKPLVVNHHLAILSTDILSTWQCGIGSLPLPRKEAKWP